METKEFVMFAVLFLIVLFLGIATTNYVAEMASGDDLKATTNTPTSDTILTNSSATLSQKYYSSVSGTVSNTTWLDFNNSARVHINEAINYSQPYTISFWMKKPGTTDAAAGYIICKSDTTGNQRAWQFHTNTGNDLWYVSYPNGTNTNTTTSQWNNFLTVNTWYHIAAVNNGSKLFLYGNGLLIDSDEIVPDSVIGIASYNGDANVTLGNCQSNAGYYNGSVDDVRLYNSVLTYAQITDLYLIGRTITIPSTNTQGYYEDWSSYSVGNDTFVPSWAAQYVGYANITSNGKLQMNYLIETGGDRDLHIQYNRSEISKGIQNLTATFQFNVTNCNASFKATETISNIGASVYLWYYDGDNFLSAEMKTNATNTGCGSGEAAQFTLYKRVGGTTTALNTQALWTFAMNTTYDVTVIFKTYNSTNYNFSTAIDGVIQRSSINITTNEVKDGSFLLEVAGTQTVFDNVNLSRVQSIVPATNQYRLNENTGTAVYDFVDAKNGVIGTGATFSTDGISNTMTSLSATAGSKTITITDSNYAWAQITVGYIYLLYSEYGFHLTIIKLVVGFIALAILSFVVIYLLKEAYGND